MSDEKTEEPTQKKLNDAKKKGEHPKSTDVTAALVFGGIALMLSSTAATNVDRIRRMVDIMLVRGLSMENPDSLMPLVIDIVKMGLLIALPFIGASALLGLLGMGAQIGLNISFEPLSPKFDKLNPASGVKNLMSIKSVIEVIKMLVKAVALVAIVWTVIRGLIPLLIGAVYLQPEGIVEVGWSAILRLFWGGLILFGIIGPVDYGIQKWQFIKGQKMSKDDIKREHKDSEGDPQLKGQRKKLAHEMVNSDLKQAVAGATVVVTNPTHYAVALRYDPDRAGLPMIVAKGVDDAAAHIRRLAVESRVPLVGDPPLARALHKIPLNQPVPEELFEAVAGIIRWVLLVKDMEAGSEDPPNKQLPAKAR